MRTAASALGLLAFLSLPSRAGVSITQASGIVQVHPSGSLQWRSLSSFPAALEFGDQVRTGSKARATITFDDGSKVELGPEGYFTLEDASASRSLVRLDLGKLNAFVSKIMGRRFEVRTPTAVCSVRGTEFSVQVLAGGRTLVDLYKGLLGVEDNRGNQVLLHPNEHIQVDVRGMNVPARLPTGAEARRESARGALAREVGLDLTKDQVIAASQREIRLAEYQQGKALVDAFGKRVRLEEYILRPSPNQFKLVVLDKRADSFNYFYYLGTFNTVLPTDLSQALRQLGGTVDAPPAWYLTAYETGRSNTVDSLREVAQGGHPVDVNHNADPADDVSFFFNPTTNQYQNVAGRSVYLTLFDRYGYYLDGKLAFGWTGTNLQTYSDRTLATAADPISGAALTSANALIDPNSGLLAGRSLTLSYPNAAQAHAVIYESYTDGSYIQSDNYVIDNSGKIANFATINGIQDYNFQQVITSSAFGGRKIDLVVEPKILLQSGLAAGPAQ